MALKQTRRSVSMSRHLYTAAAAEADRRGISLAQFVDDALRAQGVKAAKSQHMSIEHVRRAKESPEERAARKQREAEERQAKREERARQKRIDAAMATVKVLSREEVEQVLYAQLGEPVREGPIRRALGDDIANALGER